MSEGEPDRKVIDFFDHVNAGDTPYDTEWMGQELYRLYGAEAALEQARAQVGIVAQLSPAQQTGLTFALECKRAAHEATRQDYQAKVRFLRAELSRVTAELEATKAASA